MLDKKRAQRKAAECSSQGRIPHWLLFSNLNYDCKRLGTLLWLCLGFLIKRSNFEGSITHRSEETESLYVDISSVLVIAREIILERPYILI